MSFRNPLLFSAAYRHLQDASRHSSSLTSRHGIRYPRSQSAVTDESACILPSYAMIQASLQIVSTFLLSYHQIHDPRRSYSFHKGWHQLSLLYSCSPHNRIHEPVPIPHHSYVRHMNAALHIMEYPDVDYLLCASYEAVSESHMSRNIRCCLQHLPVCPLFPVSF